MANPYEKYKRHDVLMASPLELIIMLYSGCIKQLKLARMAINNQNFTESNESLQKAQDIIIELMMSLNLNFAISNELMALYEFINRQIVDINITKDDKQIEPLIEILVDLRNTWTQVQKELKQKNIQQANNN